MKEIEKKEEFNPNNNQLYHNTTYNYVTDKLTNNKNLSNPINTIYSAEIMMLDEWKTNDTFPTHLLNPTTISVPVGVKRHIERLPKKVLAKIDKDRTTAVEKCLIMVSNLTPTLFMDDTYNWKSISSKILHEQLNKGKDNTHVYSNVISALKYSTDSTNPIIESKKNIFGTDSYQEGVISKQYRFNFSWYEKNIVDYQLNVDDCKRKRIRYCHKELAKAINNQIGLNLLNLYGAIELPTNAEILRRGKELVNDNHQTNKGKKLTYLNKKSRDHFVDKDNRSFVEDNIKGFGYLTKNGYLIPKVGDAKSGGRVVDSFTLMPSWIRKMCKIDGEEIIELDYTALHPNIAISIFGGKEKLLTHQKVADRLNCDVASIKKEHLSFFNKHPNEMKQSILYDYYQEREGEMLESLILDKSKNKHNHTSKLLFKKEVEIMTDCICRLNKKGIYVMYVYDALYCKLSEVDVVKTVMNETILKYNVFTEVKHTDTRELKKSIGIIYKAENIENGMVYIGSTTKSIEQRKYDHIQKANKNVGSSFQEAIATYGAAAFKWESIDTASTLDELALKEKENINIFNSIKSGYNKDCGGGFQKTVYQFTHWGLLVGEWHSLNRAAFVVFGKEKGISNACLGNSKSYKGYYWSYDKNFTVPNDLRKKRVGQYDLENKLVGCFDSVAKASRGIGLSKSSISRVCRGERKKAGGYIWKYIH